MPFIDIALLENTLASALARLCLEGAPWRRDGHADQPPPSVLASCIVLGHTTRAEIEHLLGEPWRPNGAEGATNRVAHYVFESSGRNGRSTLSSLFLEYGRDGVVQALSASANDGEALPPLDESH
jgi:hypothetical protein